jgi:hypothetical protein
VGLPISSAFLDPRTQRAAYGLAVAMLLAFIAAVQFYGQAREKRYREAVGHEAAEQRAEVRNIAAAVNSIGVAVAGIAAAVLQREQGGSGQAQPRRYEFGLTSEQVEVPDPAPESPGSES